MEYTFGLRGHDIADNFEEMCSVASENNIRELQFAMAKTIKDINFNEVGYDSEISFRVKNALKENNLQVDVLGCYINPVNTDKEKLEQGLKLFDSFIPYARDFEATVIGTETGSNGDIISTWSEENYRVFLENICPLVRKAEDYGVTIGIEPVWQFTVSTPDKMKRMIDDIKSENLAVILDVANMITKENRNNQHKIIDQSFEFFSDRIKIIHLKDYTFEGDMKRNTIVGTGELDVKYLFNKIKKYNVPCQFILDETNVAYYFESVKRVENMLFKNFCK